MRALHGHCCRAALGFIPRISLSEIPPSKITWKAQECIKIFPAGSSTPLMAFANAEFPRIEGLCCAQAEVSVAKEKDTFFKELHKLKHHPNTTFCSRNCCTPELL